MPYSDESSEAIAARGEEIYQSLRDELESQYKGKVFVVDIETGNYEIDDEDLVATDRLLAKNPDAVTYGLRIGFGPIYKLGFRSYGWGS
ncbi:hypothetical protein C6499_14900 [Candidatus Poribacteria bacterium]|nr:MAG: hypothetical protein C6499_14900 [Candidatus Poribacteria bacterium]